MLRHSLKKQPHALSFAYKQVFFFNTVKVMVMSRYRYRYRFRANVRRPENGNGYRVKSVTDRYKRYKRYRSLQT